MNIVEYIDEATGKPNGQYAKRFEDGFIEIPREIEIIDKDTGDRRKETVIDRQVKYRDELIPLKRFCVCDSTGNIKSVHEVRYSAAIELEGKEHCVELGPGEECYPLDSWPSIPATVTDGDKLNHLVDNFKMGPEVAGKRSMVTR